METFYAETILQEDGKLTLDHLPFSQGDALQIFISASKPPSGGRHPLRGTVLKYERPFEPVAHDDWNAVQ